jgi:chitinase
MFLKIQLVILAVIFLLVSTPAQKKEIVAYYAGPHRNSYGNFLKVLDKNGSADKITVLCYAFAFPFPDSSGNIIPGIRHYPAYEEIYSGDMSIDGIADSPAQSLRGVFNQLKKLKERHPQLKVLLSVGGWGGSTYFSDLALTPQSRERFVDTCIDMYIKGNLPLENGAGGIGSAKGVFDGFDIDWEFPVSGGPEGTHYNPNDRENMSALFALFRKKLNAINPDMLLTAAISGRVWEFWKYNFNEDKKYLDWFNVMTYDFHGFGDSITGHNTNLLSSPNDPDPYKESYDHAIKYLMDSAGVSGSKIVPGAAFYARIWRNIDSTDFGLYQPVNYNLGNDIIGYSHFGDFFRQIINNSNNHWDNQAMAPWLYDPDEKTFWSFDDTRSIALKQHYVDAYNLRGLMFWAVNGDDSSGTLVNIIYNKNMPAVAAFTPKENNNPPVIKIIKPADRNDFKEGSNVRIITSAGDIDGTVAKVEFFVDGNSIGYNTIAPFDWVWFNVGSGEHQITATAFDNNGGKSSSNPVEINIIK